MDPPKDQDGLSRSEMEQRIARLQGTLPAIQKSARKRTWLTETTQAPSINTIRLIPMGAAEVEDSLEAPILARLASLMHTMHTTLDKAARHTFSQLHQLTGTEP
jgi:hypothetical protein